MVIVLRKKTNRTPDYYNLFVIGLCRLPLGVALKNHALLVMGIVFIAFGLAHKKEWRNNKQKWGDLDRRGKIVTGIITAILAILVLAGLVAGVVRWR